MERKLYNNFKEQGDRLSAEHKSDERDRKFDQDALDRKARESNDKMRESVDQRQKSLEQKLKDIDKKFKDEQKTYSDAIAAKDKEDTLG